MKKSQLIKLIRESIKGLMTEQQPIHYRWKGYAPYNPNSGFNCMGSSIVEWQINGDGQAFHQAVGSPNQGEFVGMPQNNLGLGSYGCWEYLGTTSNPLQSLNAPWYGLQTSQAQSGTTDCQSCYCQSNNPNAHGSCTPPSGCGACDSMNWSNYPTWVSTWTNNNAFQNTMQNVNQPCQHICNKITQWTAMCANAGTNQQNILACKIAEGQNQHTIHNCSTSNASAC